MTEDKLAFAELGIKKRETAEKLQALTVRLISALSRRKAPNPGIEVPGPDLYFKTAAAWWSNVLSNPATAMVQQSGFWENSIKAYLDALGSLSNETNAEASNDKRFAGEDWANNPWYNYLMRQYQVTSGAIKTAVEELDTLPETEKRRLRFFSDQIVNLMAPNNFLGSNPDALRRAVETEGESLVQGLENIVADLEKNDGELLVKLVDESAFEVGVNIATTPGRVVLRTKMIELIQYTPTTEKVHEIPLVIFPPWINKFYILDMKPQNSMIGWLVEQGYTVFVASWVNPDASYSNVGLEDYIQDGYLAAFNAAKDICKTKNINVVGYCIAGTTLALTLSYLRQTGDASVNSATFFTALTDFSDQGEFTPFLQDDFIDGIEIEVKRHGILPARVMSRTMSFLRSNDLVYAPAIRSYMMGETPPAFDLLYWNGDSTNMPGKMAMQYLRSLCQRNEFAEGTFELMGKTLSLSDVEVPLTAVVAQTDHIAAWKDCYRGMQKMNSADKTFIVSESGHIAGIVNPPSKKKYGHYTNSDLKADSAAWLDGAEYHEGSWWPRWESWLSERSGGQTKRRIPDANGTIDLGQAPGGYVMVQST